MEDISPSADRNALLKFFEVYSFISVLLLSVICPDGTVSLGLLILYWLLIYFALLFISMCMYNYLTYGKVTPWLSMLGRWKYYNKYIRRRCSESKYIYIRTFKKYECGDYLSFPRPILWII